MNNNPKQNRSDNNRVSRTANASGRSLAIMGIRLFISADLVNQNSRGCITLYRTGKLCQSPPVKGVYVDYIFQNRGITEPAGNSSIGIRQGKFRGRACEIS